MHETRFKIDITKIYDRSGYTPLHYAAHGSLETVPVLKLLCEQPALRRDIVDFQGNTALHVACKYGHYSAIAILLGERSVTAAESQQPPHYLDDVPQTDIATSSVQAALEGYSITAAAANTDMPDCASPPLVDIQNKYGSTALHFAAAALNFDAVHLLLQHQAATHIRDTAGRTARCATTC